MLFQEQGELLFTHFGLSGPLILSASAHLRDFEKNSYRVVIDLKRPGRGEAGRPAAPGAGGQRQQGYAECDG
ncbi:MAG: hypothetical protein ACLT5P_17695 [Flavonifractor plautii]